MRIFLGTGGCNLRSGANRIRLEHEIDSALHGSGELTLFYDAGVSTPSISTNPVDSLVSAVDPASPAYLSGVRYLPVGATLHVKAKALNVFDVAFHAQPITIRGGQAGFTDQNINFLPGGSVELSGYSDPPESDEPFIVNKDIMLASGFFSRDARVTAIARDPFSASTPIEIPRQSSRLILVNTLSQQSTDLIEKFTDEKYRLPVGAFNTVPGAITNQWTSANVLASGDAEVGGGLRYPQISYGQGFIPQTGQPDYSGRTGDALYCRAFRDLNNPHNSGTLKLAGLTLADIQSGGLVKVELKLPGRTGWLDLGKPFDAGAFSGAEGDGCRTSDASDEFAWTAGIHSTALSGWMIIVRITLKSPASPLLTEMRLIGW